MGTWRTLEHTADLALEGRGGTAGEALEALCDGLMAQVTDPSSVEPRSEVGIRVNGLDRAETLVSALGELLYLVNVKGWVFRRFRVREVTDDTIRMAALGEVRDPARHTFDLEIKAATYHDLHFGEEGDGGGWTARVLFDV